MNLKSDGILRLLQAKAKASLVDGSGDVVYVVFLEPHSPPSGAPPPSLREELITCAVRNLQQRPVMVHAELVVPCAPNAAQPIHFATYIGERSGWQHDRRKNTDYYLIDNANLWRAVPVFGKQAARLVRQTCSESIGVPYSMMRYVTATWPFRKLSGLVPDRPQSPAHCATLTARILRRSVGACAKHSSAWYGPSSLYAELQQDLVDQGISPQTTLMDTETADSVERILRSDDHDTRALGDERSLNAIRALTLKAAAAAAHGDATSQMLTQKQLAVALFRWGVLRDGEGA